MTNDYAAIISSVIAAVLVLGFIEVRALGERFDRLLRTGDVSEEVLEAEEGVLAAIRSGQAPAAEHLAILAPFYAEEYERTMKRVMRAGILWLGWVVLCFALVICECLVLLWAAIDKHGPAEWLAATSFIVTAFAVVVVLFGALVRSRLNAFSDDTAGRRTVDEARTLFRLLDEYQQSAGGPS